jgi:tetratricopeptide (TPR) repeat protein
VSRAACTQQLGRIALRRGSNNEALSLLSQALGLYQVAYGAKSRHINVAAVRTQLGLAHSSARDFVEAGRQFAEALEIKRDIYGRGRPHFEVATTIKSLAQSFLDRGMADEARALFLQAKSMFSRLRCSSPSPSPEAAMRGGADGGEEGRSTDGGLSTTTTTMSAKLARSVLFCCYALARIASRRGNDAASAEVAALKAEIEKLNETLRASGADDDARASSGLSSSSSSSSSSVTAAASAPSAASAWGSPSCSLGLDFSQILAGRKLVRDAAASLKRGTASIDEVKASLPPMLRAALPAGSAQDDEEDDPVAALGLALLADCEAALTMADASAGLFKAADGARNRLRANGICARD